MYGTLDEAVAALGLARASGLVERVDTIVMRLQREMFVAGAELATSADNVNKLQPGISKIEAAMTIAAEHDIDALLDEHPLRPEFVLPGETPAAAALDLARSILRRAERQAVRLQREGAINDPEVLRYLNRASDLLFACARYEESERGRSAPSSREK